MKVIAFPAERIVREIPIDKPPRREYRCACGSRLWHLKTDGAVICATCNGEVSLVVRPFQVLA